MDRLRPLFEYAYHTNDWDDDLNSAIIVWHCEAIDLLGNLHDAHELEACAELEAVIEGWNQEVVVSPIRKLPAEILSEIFLLAECDAHYDVLNTSRRHGPNRFAQVCRMWRFVSLNYAALWTRLTVKISHTIRLSEQTLAHLERVLTLSCNRLIDIHFDMGLNLGVGLAASHLWALTSHCGRWREVHLKMPTTLVKNINQHILADVSALTDITLVNIDDKMDVDDDLPRMQFLETAPVLRHVSVHGFSHSRLVPLFDTHIVAFPFHKSNDQLQSFKVHGGSAWHAIDCLSSQPSLRHLSVVNTDSGMDSLSFPSAFISKHSTLSSIFTTSSVILDALDLPNLRSASLDVAGDRRAPNQDRIFDSLGGLLARSDAHLECLAVRDLPLSQHVGFIPMLTTRRFSSLTTISLQFTEYSRQRDAELLCFTKRLLEEEDFLPRLASVDIDFSYVFYFAPVQALNREVFLRMLRSRCSEGALRHFKVTSNGEPVMSTEQEEAVMNLVSEYGLTVDIRLKSGQMRRDIARRS